MLSSVFASIRVCSLTSAIVAMGPYYLHAQHILALYHRARRLQMGYLEVSEAWDHSR